MLINNNGASIDIFTMGTLVGTATAIAVYIWVASPNYGQSVDIDISLDGGANWQGYKTISGIGAGMGVFVWKNTADWAMSATLSNWQLRIRGYAGNLIYIDEIGAKITYTAVQTYNASASGGIGLGGADSEAGNFPRTSQGGIGFGGANLEAGNFIRAVDAGLFLSGINSEIGNFIAIIEAALGLAGEAGESGDFLVTINASLSLEGETNEIADFPKNIDGAIGIAGETIEVADFLARTEGGIQLAGEITEAGNFLARVLGTIGLAGADGEVGNFLKPIDGGVGIGANVSEVGDFLVEVTAKFSIGADVSSVWKRWTGQLDAVKARITNPSGIGLSEREASGRAGAKIITGSAGALKGKGRA